MPNRVLREGILTSKRIANLYLDRPFYEAQADELFYRRLMSKWDDFGRFDADPTILRSAIYPLQVDLITDESICAHLRACESTCLLVLYSVDGKPYLQADKVDKPRADKSKYPAPPTCARTCAQTQTNAPYSYSYSGSESNTRSGSEITEKSEFIPPGPYGKYWTQERAILGFPSLKHYPELDNPQFDAALAEWSEYCEQKRKPLVPRQLTALLPKLAKMGSTSAIAAIRHSMAQGYGGVYAEGNGQKPKPKGRSCIAVEGREDN